MYNVVGKEMFFNDFLLQTKEIKASKMSVLLILVKARTKQDNCIYNF